MSMASGKMPQLWKTARIIPLYKKGCRKSLDNYRPISNLCSMDKLFEKILLKELERRHPNIEGNHQHGFRHSHSTVSAMLEVQNEIANYMDDGQGCIVYSVDLSAAFDLLRRDTFAAQLRNVIDRDLLDIIMDFLSNRKMIVEVDGKRSGSVDVNLGCVQGSVLGPKLFNVYMRSVPDHTVGHKMVSYADDSYVIIPGSKEPEVKQCLGEHLNYLKSQGMVTNLSKTEAIFFGKCEHDGSIEIGNESFKYGSSKKSAV